MKTRAPISLSALLILGYVLFRVAHLYPKWEKPGSEAVLSWDVFGYYLYLPAAFIYEDLAGLGFREDIFARYQPAGDFHHATAQPDGGFVMKYPIGMAVAYLPWFGLGHGLATHSTTHPADGFSRPYQQAIAWGMILYALLGLAILRQVLRRYYRDLEVAIVLGILVLATNYLNYTAFDGAMPHNFLFTLYALLLWLTAAWHAQPRIGLALLMGLCIGWATIIRPTELMSALIPLLWGVYDGPSLLAKVRRLWQHWPHLLALAGGLLLMGSLQLGYWKWASGHFLYYSYGEFGFDWLRPHLLNGLFSYRKGWLVYTPVMALALLGFWPLFRRQRGLFWPIALFFGLTLYVVFAWEVWWYGGSFGARPLVQSYALLALPLGAAVAAMLTRRWLAIAGVAFTLLCADLNLMMTWQAHAADTGWHAEAMTRAYFWKILGKPQVKRSDRKFLDVRRELRRTEGMRIRLLYTQDFEADTSAATTTRSAASGQRAWQLDAARQFTPAYEISLAELAPHPKAWVRVSAMTYYEQMEWSEWKMAQLSTVFFRDGQPRRQTTARIQRATEPWRWTPFHYEMRLPPGSLPTDVLKVYVWNAGSDREVLIDDLKVELIEPAE